MNPSLHTNAAIIDAFGRKRFGEVCGFTRNPAQRASDMRRRDSIPSRYWRRIVEAAAPLGLAITIESLDKAQPTRSDLEAGSQPTTPSAPDAGHATGGGA